MNLVTVTDEISTCFDANLVKPPLTAQLEPRLISPHKTSFPWIFFQILSQNWPELDGARLKAMAMVMMAVRKRICKVWDGRTVCPCVRVFACYS